MPFWLTFGNHSA